MPTPIHFIRYKTMVKTNNVIYMTLILV